MYTHYKVNNYKNNSHACTHSPHVIPTPRIISHEGLAPHLDNLCTTSRQVCQQNGALPRNRLLCRSMLQKFTMRGQLYIRFLVACRKSTYCSTNNFDTLYNSGPELPLPKTGVAAVVLLMFFILTNHIHLFRSPHSPLDRSSNQCTRWSVFTTFFIYVLPTTQGTWCTGLAAFSRLSLSIITVSVSLLSTIKWW
jgi:hypothetical protein